MCLTDLPQRHGGQHAVPTLGPEIRPESADEPLSGGGVCLDDRHDRLQTGTPDRLLAVDEAVLECGPDGPPACQ